MKKKNTKNLYRSGRNKVLGGVCGGIGEYCGVDPTIVRIIWIFSFIASWGMAILAYFILWIMMLRNPRHRW